MSITCDCVSGASNKGFTNLGHGTPVQWWVHAGCGRPTKAWFAAQGEDMINYFRGGPLDGRAYDTATMLDGTAGGDGWTATLAQYRWTPEVVTSQKTGATARVWVHNADIPAAPVAVEAVVGPADTAQEEEGAPDMATAKKNETLLERRQRGGFSRQQVADAAGLTNAKVYRIEQEGGKTTEEEKVQMAKGLDTLEAAAAKAAAADPS